MSLHLTLSPTDRFIRLQKLPHHEYEICLAQAAHSEIDQVIHVEITINGEQLLTWYEQHIIHLSPINIFETLSNDLVHAQKHGVTPGHIPAKYVRDFDCQYPTETLTKRYTYPLYQFHFKIDIP